MYIVTFMPVINPGGLRGGGSKSFQRQQEEVGWGGVEEGLAEFHQGGPSSGLAQCTASKCFTLISHT